MLSLNSKEIEQWINQFDYIHLSFDIDCLDPSVIDCVNTPVPINFGKYIRFNEYY